MPSVKSNDDNIETTDPEAFKQMLKEFRKTMQQKCKPLPEEPDYFTSDLM